MPNASRIVLTTRDVAVLSALAISPFTATQLRNVSQTFPSSFHTDQRVRARLRQLARAGFVRMFPYATTILGTLQYYQLTRLGYRMIHGADATLPHPSAFRGVSLALQPHTKLLADVLVHFVLTAHRENVFITDVCRDKTIQIEQIGKSLRPDAAFELIDRNGKSYSFFVEVDNNTEPIRAQSERNSLIEKVRLYESLADQMDRRFRVLFITRGGLSRVQHLLELAAELAPDPQRWLFYGITTDVFFKMPSPAAASFLNHQLQSVSLINLPQKHKPTKGAHDAASISRKTPSVAAAIC